MPDEFTINEKLGVLEIFSHGIVTAEDIYQSIEKSLEASKRLGINRLLVDSRKQKKMPGAVSIFRIFSTFPRHINLAILADKNQITVDDIIFGENVAVNRGIQMKVFYKREDALNWFNEIDS